AENGHHHLHHGRSHHKSHHHHHGPKPVFVSPTGSVAKSGRSCKQAKYHSIQAAIEAAKLPGTLAGCKGTYPGAVNLDRRLNLVGQRGAIVDATGDAYGIGVSASSTTVAGLTVENANLSGQIDDGIVTVGFDSTGAPTGAANHVKLVGN